MTRNILLTDIFIALAIALPIFILAGLFYYYFRRLARRMAAKTGTALDNMLVEALEWPVFFLIFLSGIYFAILYLPLKESYDFQIRRGFHLAYILLSAYGVVAFIDAIFRWFKLEITPKTRTVLDYGIIGTLRLITLVLSGIVALLVSLELFGIELKIIKNWLFVSGIRIGLIIFLSVVAKFVLGIAVPKAIKSFVGRGMPGQPEEEVDKRSKTLTGVLVTTGQVFIILVTLFIILSELGINIAPIMAGVGVVGIAIGFGAQSLIKDILSGIFIILENQYRVGDVVRIADIAGFVEEINLRRTVLRDLDGIVHVVPNGEIKVASNFTKEWSRVNLNISVSYGTDLDHAIAVINRVCKEMAQESQWAALLLNTPQVLRVDNLGDSGIELKILGDTKPIRQWEVMGELRKRIKKAFDEEGIEIPWPHTKVFFGNSPPIVNSSIHGDKKG